MDVICIKVEPIKGIYEIYESKIKYPEVGKIYKIHSETTYANKKRQFRAITLQGVFNQKIRILGRVLHFPIDWFILKTDPRYGPIVHYFKQREL